MNGMSVQEKLGVNKYELDEYTHITIDKEMCRGGCDGRICLKICPAGVYTEKGDEIAVDHAGCLECGTCYVACPRSAIRWEYPHGGFGVVYRNG